MGQPFSLPIVPRYAEIDQQGVVFNGHYLTWFDEASSAFFDHLDVSFPDVALAGFDMQVVHAELDYLAPVRWRDAVHVGVVCEGVGTTSFTLGFKVWRRGTNDAAGHVAVRGHNVYVVVSTQDWAKRTIPDPLRSALISVAAQALPSGGSLGS